VSPTARSLKFARDLGYHAEVVERWNRFSKTRHDLFGFVDIVVLADDPARLVLVQACAGASHAARAQKVKESPLLRKVLCIVGVTVEVWSWAKRGERRKVKRWTLRREVME
jgi:hypothetical protein